MDGEYLTAKAGTVTQQSHDLKCSLQLFLQSQNEKKNESVIRVKLINTTDHSRATWAGSTQDRWIRLDNVYYHADDSYADNDPWNATLTSVLLEQDHTVKHDTDGRKTINLWGHVYAPSGGWGPGHCYVASSQTAWDVALPSIDRTGATVTGFDIVNVSTNQIIIDDITADDDFGTARYYLNNVQQPAGSHWYIHYFAGLQPGTEYKIGVSVRKSSNDVWSAVYNQTIRTKVHTTTFDSVTAYAVDPFSIRVITNLNQSDNLEKLTMSVKTEDGTYIITNREITTNELVEGLLPETGYIIELNAVTIYDSGTDAHTTEVVRTPADAYCKIIRTNGQVTGNHKLYVIESNGIKTEIKKDKAHIL